MHFLQCCALATLAFGLLMRRTPWLARAPACGPLTGHCLHSLPDCGAAPTRAPCADAEVRRHFGAFGPIAEVKLYRKVTGLYWFYWLLRWTRKAAVHVTVPRAGCTAPHTLHAPNQSPLPPPLNLQGSYGFVRFKSHADAVRAIVGMNGQVGGSQRWPLHQRRWLPMHGRGCWGQQVCIWLAGPSTVELRPQLAQHLCRSHPPCAPGRHGDQVAPTCVPRHSASLGLLSPAPQTCTFPPCRPWEAR